MLVAIASIFRKPGINSLQIRLGMSYHSLKISAIFNLRIEAVISLNSGHI